VQPHDFLRRQFRLYRLWVLESRLEAEQRDPDGSPPSGIGLRFLDRHERRDWICQHTSEADWEQYRTAITHDHDLVLAQRGEQTVGWAWLGYDSVHLAPLGREIVLPRHAVYFYDCWVRPEERGRGLGRALVAARCRRARERAATTLLTHVLEGNDASRSALERNGFSIVGRTGFLRLPLLRLWVNTPFRGFRQAAVVPRHVST
jgi:ribosomal protein S18 acetylase RimI-like enzyme